MDLLEWIADERRLVADLVDGLTPQQLATRSLCDAWTVHDVTAHLVLPLVTPLPAVLLAMVTSGFDFNRANVKLTAKVARRPVAELTAELRERAMPPFKPPGLGFEAPLNDVLVHQQDIRRPLGLTAALSPERLRVCLDFAAGQHVVKARPGSAMHGLRFVADDVGWAHGDGPLVQGTGEALLLVLNRRRAALPDLHGPGADALRERLSA